MTGIRIGPMMMARATFVAIENAFICVLNRNETVTPATNGAGISDAA